MHKIFLSLFSLTIFTFCYSQQVNFTIKGRLSNKTKSQKVFLQGANIAAEAPITGKQEFYYKGSLPEPASILIKTDNSYAWGIWVAEGVIDVTLDEYYLNKLDTSGKKSLRINSISGPSETEKKEWFVNYHNELADRFSYLPPKQRNDSVAKYLYLVLEDYITNHPNSKFSSDIIRNFAFRLNIEQKSRLLVLLNKEFNEEEVKRIETGIRQENLLRQGYSINNSEIKTLNGALFSLNKTAAKYTLLEFWASWCAPCRKKNPALVQVYN